MRFLFIAMVLCLSTPAIAQSTMAPQASVTVLVDLSATWLKSGDAKLNERILKQVASAIVATAADLDPPIVVRYLSIGDGSLGREPLCEVTMLPQIIVNKKEDGIVNTIRDLDRFLSVNCVKFVLSRPSEQFTDITGALDSVSRANEEQTGTYKAVIVLSDLQEERRPGQRGTMGRLNGANVVLLYRTLPQDRYNNAALDARIGYWKKRLSASGASVKAMSDVFAVSGSIAGALSGGR